jgi:hypothetical protein
MTALPYTRCDDAAVIARRIGRGAVWCIRCAACQGVDGEACMANGWPRHCRATMTIDSPEERKR